MKKYWKHVRINGDFWLEMHTFFSLASFWHLLMKITYTRHKMKAIAACAKEHSFSEHESLTNIYAKRLPFSHHIVECTDAVILLHTFARQMKLHSGQSHCIAGKCNAESQTKCEETKYLPGIGNKFRNLSSVDKITVRRHSKTHSNGICLFFCVLRCKWSRHTYYIERQSGDIRGMGWKKRANRITKSLKTHFRIVVTNMQ